MHQSTNLRKKIYCEDANFDFDTRCEIAHGLIHDLNNILMIIHGNISMMLLQSKKQNPQYERLVKISSAMDNAFSLVRKLFNIANGRYSDFYYKNSQKAQLLQRWDEWHTLLQREVAHNPYEVIDINDLLKKINFLFSNEKYSIVEDFELYPWPVKVNQHELSRAFMNIYKNSIDVMPQGGTIYVKTQNVYLDNSGAEPLKLLPGKYVTIRIKDTGLGMDEKVLSNIFKPFYTTKGNKKIGLGLPIVKMIIEGHNGGISVHSKKGEGSTFEIFLPADQNG